MARLSVLILAPYLNGKGLGEVYSIFKWVEALAHEADLTILTISGERQEPLATQQPKARVIRLREPAILQRRFTRLNAMAKPYLPVFFSWARRWIRREMAAGARFDIGHQILPQAMRYASPFRGLGLPYVIGPLGGSLSTPKAWKREVRGGAFYTRLRALDRPRLAYDPRLRASFGGADLILGVAPYVHDTLRRAGIKPRRFEAVPERGHDGKLPKIKPKGEAGELQLLHVGRVVRTKALRDMVRAMALLRDLPGVRLTSAGDGEDLAACKAEAAALGVAERIDFLGQVTRDEVERLYASSDVFAFPSFREPMGGVFFEAMAYGLPVIAAARGGPDFIIDDSCGFRLPVRTPDQFSADIAATIRRLADDPELRLNLGRGAQARLTGFGDWAQKARGLVALYEELIGARKARQSG